MTFASSFDFPCQDCQRPKRSVFGSAEWHAEHDPAGGYCHCDIAELRAVIDMAVAPPDGSPDPSAEPPSV